MAKCHSDKDDDEYFEVEHVHHPISPCKQSPPVISATTANQNNGTASVALRISFSDMMPPYLGLTLFFKSQRS